MSVRDGKWITTAVFAAAALIEVIGAVFFSRETAFWLVSAFIVLVLFVESRTFAAVVLMTAVFLLNVYITVRHAPAFHFLNEGNHLELVDVFTALALASVFVGRSLKTVGPYRSSGVELPMLALFLVAVVSLLWAKDVGAGWVVLTSFAMCMALFYMPLFLLRDRAGTDIVLWFILIASIGAMAFSLSTLYYDNDNFNFYRNTILENPFLFRIDVIYFENIKERIGGYSDPNRMALIFNTVLLTGLALYQTRKSVVQKAVIGVILVAVLFTDLHAFSKGGLIALMAGMITYIAFNPYYKDKRLRSFVTYLILSIILFILVIATSQEGLGRFGANPVETRKGSSLGLRFEWWAYDFKELLASDWLGMGVGQLSKYEWGYLQNTYFSVFTDLGLIGGAIFLWLSAAYLYRLHGKLKACKDGYFHTVSLAFSCSLLIFSIHTLIDFGYILRIPWLVAGFALATASLGSQALKEANS